MVKLGLKLLLAIQIVYLPMMSYAKPIAERLERETNELFTKIKYRPGQTTIGEMLKEVKPFISPKSYLRLFERTKKSHNYKVPDFKISNNILTFSYNKKSSISLDIRDQVTSFYKINNTISSSILDIFLIDPFADQLTRAMKIKKTASIDQNYLPTQLMPFYLIFGGNLEAQAADPEAKQAFDTAYAEYLKANEQFKKTRPGLLYKSNQQALVDAIGRCDAALAYYKQTELSAAKCTQYKQSPAGSSTQEPTDVTTKAEEKEKASGEGVTMANFPWWQTALVAATIIGGFFIWNSAKEVKKGLANINVKTNSTVAPITVNGSLAPITATVDANVAPITGKLDTTSAVNVNGTVEGKVTADLNTDINVDVAGLENGALKDKISGLVTQATELIEPEIKRLGDAQQ